jgi:phosphoglycolate phosphatase
MVLLFYIFLVSGGKSMNLDRIKLIATDWSGVVSDDRMPVYLANQEMLKLRGLPLFSFEDWPKHMKASAPELMWHMGADPQKESYEDLQSEFKSLLGVYMRQHPPFLYQDAFEVMSVFRETHRLAVVSTHPTERLENEIVEYGLGHYFTQVFGSSQCKATDLKQLLCEYSCSCEEVLFIGDMPFDVQKGREAGVLTAAVTTGYAPRHILEKENPDFLCDSLTQLLGLLTKASAA